MHRAVIDNLAPNAELMGHRLETCSGYARAV